MNRQPRRSGEGKLKARPGIPSRTGSKGLQRLELGPNQEAILYVPTTYRPASPAPFILALHGAGGNATAGLGPLLTFADEHGIMLLAPSSIGGTWDRIRDGFGTDSDTIDRALNQVFGNFNVDPRRLAAEGFSDGASYALSLGMTNGNLFTHVVAFSPGFVAPGNIEGTPSIFISHGTRDTVLPIDSCSRRIVPVLRRAGYDLVYREFDGGHDIPAGIARDAIDWILENPADRRRSAAS